MAKIARGESAGLPLSAQVFLIAAAFGQTPDQVRAWPADDVRTAWALMGAIRRVD